MDGLCAFLFKGDVELDELAFAEGAKAVGFDGGVVDEEVFAAVVWGDKAVAFVVVEPLHCSF